MSGSIELDGEDYAGLQERIQALEQQNAALERERICEKCGAVMEMICCAQARLIHKRQSQDVQKLVDAARPILGAYLELAVLHTEATEYPLANALAEALKPFSEHKK